MAPRKPGRENQGDHHRRGRARPRSGRHRGQPVAPRGAARAARLHGRESRTQGEQHGRVARARGLGVVRWGRPHGHPCDPRVRQSAGDEEDRHQGRISGSDAGPGDLAPGLRLSPRRRGARGDCVPSSLCQHPGGDQEGRSHQRLRHREPSQRGGLLYPRVPRRQYRGKCAHR